MTPHQLLCLAFFVMVTFAYPMQPPPCSTPSPPPPQQDYPGLPNLPNSASLFSRLTFKFVSPLISRSKTTPLTLKDTYLVPPPSSMSQQVPFLQALYNKRRSAPSVKSPANAYYLARSIIQSQREDLKITALYRVSNTLIQAFPALFVAKILKSMEQKAPPLATFKWAFSLFLVLVLKMIVENQYFHSIVMMGTKVRRACIAQGPGTDPN